MPTLHLFEGFGIELEYKIVSQSNLAVLPISDQLLKKAAGEWTNDFEDGPASWGNELVLHVMEIRNTDPLPIDGLEAIFTASIAHLNRLAAEAGGRLMPTGMHPWMIPADETKLWPHEYHEVYRTFDRIFNCRRHGWANLESCQINLPFANDEEFSRLHAAVRMILPLLPALAASTPLVEGKTTGILDNRLHAYRDNSRLVPSIAGRCIPEPVYSRQAYQKEILEKIYGDIRPHDPEKILQYEWLNARGAIARFDRSAIEVRILDMQECPAADLAVVETVIAVLKQMTAGKWCPTEIQQAWTIDDLETLLLDTIRSGEASVIRNPAYLEAFGLPGSRPLPAGEIWQHLLASLPPAASDEEVRRRKTARTVLESGSLSRRILTALQQGTPLQAIYEELCNCLDEGRLFRAKV